MRGFFYDEGLLKIMKEAWKKPEAISAFLTDFIVKELSRTGHGRLVVGVSGGVDSAVVSFLAVKALERENVVGVIMPYKTSSIENMADAHELIDILGIKKYEVEISAPVDHYFKMFPAADLVRRGNKMARERMSVLYDISSLEKALVIGTSNKSEILLGYGTIFGDLACALNPLGDLYKTQVRELAEYLAVPEKIITKTPSADLYSGQSDEGEFGFSYEEVDKLLYFIFDKGYSEAECIECGFDQALIRRVLEMNAKNKFKGSLPVIARLSDMLDDSNSNISPEQGK